ncbi:V-type proton ATPase subunit H [Thecamonas trahens ATCC 50062]|uniref:V-type proton ATPase subunit H n=1 Tax=Thecamonas trahens ATCC 50062 TaxID=461836 RepID=A0A0L0DH02_THETB|nr:V-type proton ATPase subunit H [Thecamonas trahens ATCC 50062]KNC51416.1 V-type proton ATPase subunit H [Thecamonas trahens ATCC 50062]|eukprot:XP_013756082.1 V-type proton ATPase subunit H [Thecamonas trahens ATCC 50062]
MASAVPMASMARPFAVEDMSDTVRTRGMDWSQVEKTVDADQADIAAVRQLATVSEAEAEEMLATAGPGVLGALLRLAAVPTSPQSELVSYLLVIFADTVARMGREQLSEAACQLQAGLLAAEGIGAPPPDLVTGDGTPPAADDPQVLAAATAAAARPPSDLGSRTFPLLPAGVDSPVYGPLLRILARADVSDPKAFFVVSKVLEVIKALARAPLPIGVTQLADLLAWAHNQTVSSMQRASSSASASASTSAASRVLASADATVSTMSGSSSFLEPAVGLLQTLLRYNSVRQEFWARPRAFDAILSLIVPESLQFQLIYQALNVLWLLSYSADIAAEMPSRGPVIPLLMRVLKRVRKENEKVFRMAIGVVINLVDRGQLGSAIVEVGMVKYGKTLLAHAWKDADMIERIEALLDSLRVHEEDLSTFGQYKEEVLSGLLTWSPVHKSEAFWRININKFEWEEWRLLRVLIQLISSSQDPLILAVAAHDLGEFVRIHPAGKRILTSLEGKDALMALMTHADESVREHALVAVQKMLVKNYSFTTQ